MEWHGERMCQIADECRHNFLYGTPGTDIRASVLRQTTVKTVTGIEWMSRMILRGVADRAVDLTEWVREASSW